MSENIEVVEKKVTKRKPKDFFKKCSMNGYVQACGKEYDYNEIVEKIKVSAKDLVTEDVTSVRFYIKPEENMVYYILNDDIKGEVEI